MIFLLLLELKFNSYSCIRVYLKEIDSLLSLLFHSYYITQINLSKLYSFVLEYDVVLIVIQTQEKKLNERATELEEEVRHMINRVDTEPLSLLELIDNVQRLGLTYKFEEDIVKALDDKIALLNENEKHKSGLHATALRFRLLRQHGFHVSQGILMLPLVVPNTH